jgi:uncharacterized protein (DUF2336 family)
MERPPVAPRERAVNLILADRLQPEQAARATPSIVRRFLIWAQAADADERVGAANALARAYRYGDLPTELRREAVIGMTAMLEDRSILVRRALAESLASAGDAPRHVVLALANDQPEIAAIMVARSPVLNDADLVDCAAVGDDSVQIAVARRPALGIGAAAALAEVGGREATIALLENHEARLTIGAMRRLAERFVGDGEIREALLARRWLPAVVRCDLMAATAEALSPLAAGFGLSAPRIQRLMREACEEGAIVVAGDADGDDLVGLVRRLRASGGLTISLLMRGLVSGDRALFEAAAPEPSGLPPDRVAAFARAPHGSGFAALYRRTTLPMQYFTPVREALAALGRSVRSNQGGVVRTIVTDVIAACEAEADPRLDRLLSFLRRLETEAALKEARAAAAELAAKEVSASGFSASIPVVTIEPVLIESEPLPLLIALNELSEGEVAPTPAEPPPLELVAEAPPAPVEPPPLDIVAESPPPVGPPPLDVVADDPPLAEPPPLDIVAEPTPAVAEAA